MTNEQAIEMMKAKLECMTRDVSGVDLNCNAKKCDECDLCYAQGNMGEQKEWLRMGIKALENQRTGYWIDDSVGYGTSCSQCGNWYPHSYLTKQDIIYCCKCGAKMQGE